MMGVWPRFNTIKALLKERARSRPALAPLIKEFDQLAQKSRALSERRNRIIHDPWYVESRSYVTAQYRSMPKGELTYGIQLQDEAELRAVVGDIVARSADANRLMVAVKSVLASAQT